MAKRNTPPVKPAQPEPPSPRVMKLQMAGAVFIPAIGLWLWLHSKGFW